MGNCLVNIEWRKGIKVGLRKCSAEKRSTEQLEETKNIANFWHISNIKKNIQYFSMETTVFFENIGEIMSKFWKIVNSSSCSAERFSTEHFHKPTFNWQFKLSFLNFL